MLIFETSTSWNLFKYEMKKIAVSKICVNLVDFPHSEDTSLVSQRNVQHKTKWVGAQIS